MRLNLTPLYFLMRLLPVHKRQQNRISLFYWPLKIVKTAWDNWLIYRKNCLYKLNVTGQTLSLQSYLNKIFCSNESEGNTIYISHGETGGVDISLSTEPDNTYILVGLSYKEKEESAYQNFYLDGENSQATAYDFSVYIPSTLNEYAVANVINQYKLAGKQFNIIKPE